MPKPLFLIFPRECFVQLACNLHGYASDIIPAPMWTLVLLHATHRYASDVLAARAARDLAVEVLVPLVGPPVPGINLVRVYVGVVQQAGGQGPEATGGSSSRGRPPR